MLETNQVFKLYAVSLGNSTVMTTILSYIYICDVVKIEQMKKIKILKTPNLKERYIK